MNHHTPVPAPILMKGARWLVEFRQRHSSQNYADILFHLRKSQNRAGGPALRLAQAVWNYDYRVLFPNDGPLKVAEENSFAHLMLRHRSMAKSRNYHVWKAIEMFAAQRKARFGEALLAVVTEPPLAERNPVQHAFYHLVKAMHGMPGRKPNHLVHLLATTNPSAPAIAEILVKAIQATTTYALWQHNTLDIELFTTFQEQVNELLHQRYKQRAFLGNVAPPLVEAISRLHRLLSDIPP